MPNQFFSPEGDLENYFVTEYWLIDQYVGDELWAWGNAINGRLGNATTTPIRSTPVTTSSGGINWKLPSGTSNASAAIKTDGTLWVWGTNTAGGLALGPSTASPLTPVTTFAGGNNWKSLSGTTSAIKTDGTLWVWGSATGGRLGNATTTPNRSTPVTTFAGGNNWKQVSGTAAVKTDGTLWVWGDQARGRLGNGVTTGSISTPVTTFAGGNNWKQVSTGGQSCAAVKTDGTLWTWGNGSNGRLGNGVTTGSISTPVTTFAGGNNWKQVSCGDIHVAAIKTDGTLWTWGYGNNGRLGNAVTTGNISTPVTTFAGGTNWKQVSGGDLVSAAIKTDGTLWIWGSAVNGSLGNTFSSSAISIPTPITTFMGGTNWKYVSVNH